MPSISSANTIFVITIANLYPTPVQLQNYAADDILDIDALKSAETMMGVDGILSGGFVNVPWVQKVHLMGSSNSNLVFETWWASSLAAQDVYVASGTITYPSIKKVYTLTTGFLTSYKPLSAAKKLLQPREYEITWQIGAVSPTP